MLSYVRFRMTIYLQNSLIIIYGILGMSQHCISETYYFVTRHITDN